MERKIKSMLSLCRKAGFLVVGEDACLKSIRSSSAKLVLICGDASDNTKKRFSQKAFFYNVPYYTFSEKAELSAVIGTKNSATAVIADSGFAVKIEGFIKNVLQDQESIKINELNKKQNNKKSKTIKMDGE